MGMARGKITEEERQKQRDEHKLRTGAQRAARRSGKPIKKEGKVSKSRAKTSEARSSKKLATVRKRSRS